METCPFNSSACNTLQNSLRFLRRSGIPQPSLSHYCFFTLNGPGVLVPGLDPKGRLRGFLSLLGHKDQGQERQVGTVL